MLPPSPLQLLGSIATVLSTITFIIHGTSALQIPLHDSAKKQIKDIPSIGLGLWNSKDKDVSIVFPLLVALPNVPIKTNVINILLASFVTGI